MCVCVLLQVWQYIKDAAVVAVSYKRAHRYEYENMLNENWKRVEKKRGDKLEETGEETVQPPRDGQRAMNENGFFFLFSERRKEQALRLCLPLNVSEHFFEK